MSRPILSQKTAMKKVLLLLFVCAFGAVFSAEAEVIVKTVYSPQYGEGYEIATQPVGQPVGFFGASPVIQASGTAELALSDSTGGTIPAAVTITATSAHFVNAFIVKASGTGSSLLLPLARAGDIVQSAAVLSGTITLSGTQFVVSGTTLTSGTVVTTGTAFVSATADFESTISGSAAVLQTGTSILSPGATVLVTVGRISSWQAVPLTSATSTAATNADIATLARSINELRRTLTNLGLIKGGP